MIRGIAEAASSIKRVYKASPFSVFIKWYSKTALKSALITVTAQKSIDFKAIDFIETTLSSTAVYFPFSLPFTTRLKLGFPFKVIICSFLNVVRLIITLRNKMSSV